MFPEPGNKFIRFCCAANQYSESTCLFFKSLKKDCGGEGLILKHHTTITSRREKIGIKEFKNPKAFIDYSQAIDDIYENLENFNLAKKRKVLIVFDDMIADMEETSTLHLFLYHNVISKCLEL